MASSINASTSGAGGVITTADNTGILNLQTAGTNAVTVDTSQRVGIGTTSPNCNFQVNGIVRAATDNDKGVFSLGESAGAYSVNVGLWRGGANSAVSISTGIVTTGGNFLNLGGYDGIAFTTGAANIGSQTERMRITSTGNIGLGVSNPTSPVNMLSGQNFNGGFCIRNTGGSSWEFVTGGDNKLYMGYAASGTPAAVGNFATNGTYTATSDIRKKKDISYIFNGLDIINSLKPAQGRMLEDDDTSPLRPMFIAQDMVDVIPALVSNLEPTPSDDPLLGVDYASITPILVKAIQEQQTIIEDLKSRITALEAK